MYALVSFPVFRLQQSLARPRSERPEVYQILSNNRPLHFTPTKIPATLLPHFFRYRGPGHPNIIKG